MYVFLFEEYHPPCHIKGLPLDTSVLLYGFYPPLLVRIDYVAYLNKGCNADPLFNFEYRGPVTMKGKSEPMDVWFLTRSKEYIV
uniref:Uncharacterized protein n=1 Tax=Timema cristinae TaxID=61476 RepID=A0A7R9CAC0_TIMCR|nr:unnamed protein product [Timema cristinae]